MISPPDNTERGDMPAEPGTLFVLKLSDIPFAFEWLVVSDHPDDKDLVNLIPVDDFWRVGAPDLRIAAGQVARCGSGLWFPVERLEVKVGTVSTADLMAVRQRIHELATGTLTQPATEADADPEYHFFLDDVERARNQLLKSI
jgi:hypothetical protein